MVGFYKPEMGGDARRFLWLRNNGSTLVSQALNTILFNVGAFWGIYSAKTILSIALSSYVIFLVTSLADTPVCVSCQIFER